MKTLVSNSTVALATLVSCVILAHADVGHAKETFSVSYQKYLLPPQPNQPLVWVGTGLSSTGVPVNIKTTLYQVTERGNVTAVEDFQFAVSAMADPTVGFTVDLTGIIVKINPYLVKIRLKGTVISSTVSYIPVGTDVRLRSTANPSLPTYPVNGAMYLHPK